MIPILKLARFFPHRIGGEKARQLELFFTEWSRYYIVLALEGLQNGIWERHLLEIRRNFDFVPIPLSYRN